MEKFVLWRNNANERSDNIIDGGLEKNAITII
jgi:hypothetical protein